MCTYQDSKQLTVLKEGFRKAGKKLNMGKSCVRFRRFDTRPLDVVAKVIAAVPPEAFIHTYESARKKTGKGHHCGTS